MKTIIATIAVVIEEVRRQDEIRMIGIEARKEKRESYGGDYGPRYTKDKTKEKRDRKKQRTSGSFSGYKDPWKKHDY